MPIIKLRTRLNLEGHVGCLCESGRFLKGSSRTPVVCFSDFVIKVGGM